MSMSAWLTLHLHSQVSDDHIPAFLGEILLGSRFTPAVEKNTFSRVFPAVEKTTLSSVSTAVEKNNDI